MVMAENDTNLDQHAYRNLDAVEEPLDAAGESLANALRSSFSVLKGIMMVLVVLYMVSNVRSIGSHEQALVLRLGRLLPGVHEAGLAWAFPYPIDEIVPLPTRKSNDLRVASHTFRRHGTEVGKPLSFLARSPGQGLHPVFDGALLTADAGLVHVQWKITYKIDDVVSYATTILGDKVEAAESLILSLVETIGIQVASEMTAEEITRTKVDTVQSEMRRRLNRRLDSLGSGIAVTVVEMFELTPPLQVRSAFDFTQRAENTKQKMIRDSEKQRTQVLSEAAGVVFPRFVELLDQIDAGGAQGATLDELRTELNRMLDEEVEGEAGRRLKKAGAYRAGVVSRIRNEVERYRMLLPEYKRNPLVLINRLWEQTRQEIFASPGVTKFYRPSGLMEFRLQIPLDPKETRLREAQQLQKEQFNEAKLLRKAKVIPVGPEHD
jgi:membrane protease subunit HflK